MEKTDHQDVDPVLQLQSHQALAPNDARDGAHPGRDQTLTPHTHSQPQSLSHHSTAPADGSNDQSPPSLPPEQAIHQDTHPPAPQQDASGASDPAQTRMPQLSTPVLPPMTFQQPPQQQPHAPAQTQPPPAPAPAPASAHAPNGHPHSSPPQHANHIHPQHHPPQQQHHPPPPQHTNGTPGQYQPHPHAPPPPSNYSYPPEAAMQQPPPPGPVNGYAPHMAYQMPLGAPHLNTNQLPGTRHKKEIKRRTKTGCLTCRKRRIKCDEGHPTCRNCQKSKRECLGYDPIFKSQAQPQTIQPAPGTLPPAPAPPVKQEPQAAAPEPQRYSNVPQGYMPAASAGYSPATVMPPPIDFAAAIDPALAPVNPPPLQPHQPLEEYTTSLRPQRNVRLVSVDSLFSLDDVPPAFPPRDLNVTLPPHEVEMIRHMYMVEYAAGLDRFLETTWYTDHGFNLLLGNMELLHYFAHCVERFRQGQNGSATHGLMSLEARLIWQLGALPRAVQSNAPPYHVTLLQRLDTVQNLLCGTFMDTTMVPVSPPANPPDPKHVEQYTQYLQDAFWHQLGRFVSIRDDVVSPDAAQQTATALAAMRNILSMLENRDVLYSMAIARHFGGRMVDFHMDKTLVSKSAEPDDPIAKLAVAMNFIRDEDSQGTTQVVQRLCGMCRRGWVLQRQTPTS